MKISNIEVDPKDIEKLSRSYGDGVPTIVEIQCTKGRSDTITAHTEAAKAKLSKEFDALFQPPPAKK